MGQITISIGVASYRVGEEAETLIDRADRALYVSKNGGRNRVSVDKD
jgi:diguanylate cyclase